MLSMVRGTGISYLGRWKGTSKVAGLQIGKPTFASATLAAALRAASMTLSMASAAHAQAFDCTRARLTAEHLICQDKALSSLDLELYTAYGGALDVAADPDGVIISQRAWLKQRNACGDSACMESVYKARLHALAAGPHAAMQTGHFPALGISLSFLGNQKAKPCDTRCIEIYGRRMGQQTMLLRLQAVNEPLEQAAGKEAGFEQKDGQWMTTFGRLEPVPVERISGEGWIGLKAVIMCETNDPQTGLHPAGGECLWAVLSDGPQSVVVTTDGYEGPDELTKDMIGSLKFEH
jgi:uncharacterized protein